MIQQAVERLNVLARKGWSQELRREMHDLLPESRLEMPARLEALEEASLGATATLN
jgi:hypothetical protein